MVRNISINNQKVNDYLDSLPKRTRSYFIEQAILLSIEFENGSYLKKDEIEDLIKTILNTLSDNNIITTKQLDNNTTDTIKNSIISILNM